MTGLDYGLPSTRDQHEARASLVIGAGEAPGLSAAIWMGGARSILGQALDDSTLANSLVIDCAGELAPSYRTIAAEWIPCVFVDHDGPIPAMRRLEDTARRAARAAGDGSFDAVYVMCTHGMNRSGLVAGMIMRELGMRGSETVERIVAARPGALSNLWFRQLLAEG